MREFLDPTYWYLLIFGSLLAVSIGTGYVASNRLSVLGGLILLALLGLLAGQYVTGVEAELFGAFSVAALMGIVVAALMPLPLELNLAVFLVGFLTGLSIHRRH